MSRSTQAISPSDLEEGERIATAAGVPLTRVRFGYNFRTDRWSLFDGDGDVLLATREAAGIVWTEV